MDTHQSAHERWTSCFFTQLEWKKNRWWKMMSHKATRALWVNTFVNRTSNKSNQMINLNLYVFWLTESFVQHFFMERALNTPFAGEKKCTWVKVLPSYEYEVIETLTGPVSFFIHSPLTWGWGWREREGKEKASPTLPPCYYWPSSESLICFL